jgi:hypothetical protein
MSTKQRLSKKDFYEVRSYIKKLRKEGSTTANADGYLTANAWVGDEDAEGTQAIDVEDEQYSFSVKPSKITPHLIQLKEANYKSFKEDTSGSHVQKVNRKVLEINQRLREISQALDHSIKLKNESAIDNSRYWKKTNEAMLKMKARISEVNKKISQLANLKEIAANSVKDKLVQLLIKAGIAISAQDVEYNQVSADHYEFDIMMDGEPIAIDYNKGQLIYQGYDEEIDLGNLNQEQDVIAKLSQTLNK